MKKDEDGDEKRIQCKVWSVLWGLGSAGDACGVTI